MDCFKRQKMYYANKKGKGGTWDFNCWGATLYVLGAQNKLEWVRERHMINWLNIHTQIHVIPEEFGIAPDELVPGDIIVLWDNGVLEHTAVYIGRGKFFHKRGPNVSEITTIYGVLKHYEFNHVEYRRPTL